MLAILLGGAISLTLAGLLMAARPPQLSKEFTEQAYRSAMAVGDNPQTCRSTIGKQPALALVRYCRWVSSATHPPCNSQNSCAIIVDHIRGMCRGSKSKRLPCGEGMTDAQWRRVSQIPAL
jgi:hypothetical protein